MVQERGNLKARSDSTSAYRRADPSPVHLGRPRPPHSTRGGSAGAHVEVPAARQPTPTSRSPVSACVSSTLGSYPTPPGWPAYPGCLRTLVPTPPTYPPHPPTHRVGAGMRTRQGRHRGSARNDPKTKHAMIQSSWASRTSANHATNQSMGNQKSLVTSAHGNRVI